MNKMFRNLLEKGAWPTNMTYLSCADFEGTNTPERNIDLRSYFTTVDNAITIYFKLNYKIIVFFRLMKTPAMGRSTSQSRIHRSMDLHTMNLIWI